MPHNHPTTPAPDSTFPSYEDATSGRAPFPDIPVTSYAQLIIDPPPSCFKDERAETNIEVRIVSSNIGARFDTYRVERLIEERERWQARRWVIMADSGVSF